jgi:hypothetical protein
MDNHIILKILNWDGTGFTEKECMQGELYQIGMSIVKLLSHSINKKRELENLEILEY